MKEDTRPGLTLISGYGAGGFSIRGVRHQGHLLITPEGFYPWQVKSIKSIKKQSLKPMFESGFEAQFLLLGLGDEVLDGPVLAQKFVKTFDLPCEVMTTGAAVRTYNVLILEGRQVAAALIAI